MQQFEAKQTQRGNEGERKEIKVLLYVIEDGLSVEGDFSWV